MILNINKGDGDVKKEERFLVGICVYKWFAMDYNSTVFFTGLGVSI